MELKEGFKQTEVGVIPNDWGILSISKIGSIHGRVGWKGYTVKDLRDSGAYAIGAKHIDKQNKLELSDPTFLSQEKYLESPEIMVYRNDILIVQRGTIGKVVLIDIEIGDATINPSMLIFRLKSGIQAYAYYYLISSGGQKQITNDTSSTGVPMITQKQVLNFKIPLPPLPEQTAIATALSDMDELISQTEKLIEKKKAIKQGVMQELLRPREGWVKIIVKDFVEIPVTDGPHETPVFVKVGVPFLSVNNIVDNRIDQSDLRFVSKADDARFSKKCKPKRHDILLGKAASVGKVALVYDNWDFNIWSPLALIRVKAEYSSLYTFYYFQTKNIKNQIDGLTNSSSQGNIGMGDIEKLIFSFPNNKEEREAIGRILHDIDEEIIKIKTKLQKLKYQKQGMMQALLTGKIRLL